MGLSLLILMVTMLALLSQKEKHKAHEKYLLKILLQTATIIYCQQMVAMKMIQPKRIKKKK